ncbi:hypothetical protein N7453_010967 [Penicillium expansum]|nr:hypothetical protein N7453_010967 [Penicillium expansum]
MPSQRITVAGEYFLNEKGFLGLATVVIFPAIPAICKEFKHIIRIKPSRLGAEGALRIGHAE